MKNSFGIASFFGKRRWKKTLIRMKLLTMLMLVSVLQLSANVKGQNAMVNMNMHNANLIEFFSEITDQTDYEFLYNYDLVLSKETVSLEVNHEDLKELLEDVLHERDLDYQLDDNVIIISEREFVAPVVGSSPVIQEKIVKGKVTDDQGISIPGVSVIVKGTNVGVATDMDGNYSIEVKSNNVILVFSSIGMKSQEVVYKGQSNINVILAVDTQNLNEVVVTGIFEKPRESFTGSVSNISKDDLVIYKGQNVIQTIRNIDPSIYIALDNAAGSDPNRMPNMSIRGSSSLPTSLDKLKDETQQQLNYPLVIMDGFEITLRKLMDFNDEEIESINVLKDASATAIYGSRGANGVIVIKTKDPTAGKLRFSLRAGVEISVPDLSSYNLMNAREKLEVERLAGLYDSEEPIEDLEYKSEYNDILEDIESGVDTYWLNEPIRTGIGDRVNLRIEGGSEQFRWSTSLNNRNTRGVMKGSDRKVTDASVTLQYNHKNILFRNQSSYAVTNIKNSKYGEFSSYANMNPYWKLKDENGDYYEYYSTRGKFAKEYQNPLWNSRLNIIDEARMQEIRNNFSVEYSKKGLKARMKMGISRIDNTSDKFLPPNHAQFRKYDQNGDQLRKGSYSMSIGYKNTLDFSSTLSYSKLFADKHQVYLGFDYSISNTKGINNYIDVEGFPSEFMTDFGNALQYKEKGKPASNDEITRRVGFTGNFNYTYDNRLYIDGSYRIDGSSQFGNKKRFAPFWSIGAGWNINRENFLVNNTTINKLRLKMSYGQSGSQQFSAYQALSTLRYYTNDRYHNWNGATLLGLGNENLTWQTTNQVNVGLESVLFNNRVNASIDVYVKSTSNLLSTMQLPYANGFNSFTDNVGEIRNTGFEASLGGMVIRKESLSLNVTAKLAYNETEVTKLSEALKLQTEENLKGGAEVANLLYEGYDPNSIWAVRSLGIDPSTGKEIFVDRNGELTNIWNSNDKVYQGVSNPKYRGNLSSLLIYKNFSLNLSFAYHFGGKAYNQTLLNKVEVPRNQLGSNLDKRVLSDRWFKSGDVTFFKGINDNVTRASSRFVMDDNVFQLQSANVKYKFSSKYLTEKFNIQSANISMNMNDIFYLSSIKRERGTSYPFARTITFAFSVMF